jgi:hypothetical protein
MNPNDPKHTAVFLMIYIRELKRRHHDLESIRERLRYLALLLEYIHFAHPITDYSNRSQNIEVLADLESSGYITRGNDLDLLVGHPYETISFTQKGFEAVEKLANSYVSDVQFYESFEIVR